MATKEIKLRIDSGLFKVFFNRLKRDDNFSGVRDLRRLLSNEKAKLLYIIKKERPESIYQLAKFVGRDFQSVRNDIKVLEKFGFVELISSHKNGRERIMPVVDIDELVITINL